MSSGETWVSRAPAMAQRFTDLVGQPPMQYLAHWRLQIAAQELMSERKSLAAVAEQVGYESEAAFNRAFKREFGMPPAGWRKNRRSADALPRAPTLANRISTINQQNRYVSK